MERKSAIAIVLLTITVIICVYVFNQPSETPSKEKEIVEVDTFDFEEVELNWIVIGGFKIKKGDTVIYVDPKDVNRKDYELLEPADYIIITHDHIPHYSPVDMYYLSDDETIWLTAPGISVTRANQQRVYPGDSLSFEDVAFEFVPSYNVDKRRPSGELFHPPEEENVGVIVDFDGTRVYHSGDTDVIMEMREISANIALLPVSGYAWMSALEAVDAVELLKESGKLEYVIPIHYGYNQGTDTDALVFSTNVNCSVVILPRLFDK